MPGFSTWAAATPKHWGSTRDRAAWNDPDYMLLGYLAIPFRQNQVFRLTSRRAKNYFYMSMWSMMASPLFFGGRHGAARRLLLKRALQPRGDRH